MKRRQFQFTNWKGEGRRDNSAASMFPEAASNSPLKGQCQSRLQEQTQSRWGKEYPPPTSLTMGDPNSRHTQVFADCHGRVALCRPATYSPVPQKRHSRFTPSAQHPFRPHLHVSSQKWPAAQRREAALARRGGRRIRTPRMPHGATSVQPGGFVLEEVLQETSTAFSPLYHRTSNNCANLARAMAKNAEMKLHGPVVEMPHGHTSWLTALEESGPWLRTHQGSHQDKPVELFVDIRHPGTAPASNTSCLLACACC